MATSITPDEAIDASATDVATVLLTRKAWCALLDALEGTATAAQREWAQDLLIRTAPLAWCESLDA